jgi:hypothetical protein
MSILFRKARKAAGEEGVSIVRAISKSGVYADTQPARSAGSLADLMMGTLASDMATDHVTDENELELHRRRLLLFQLANSLGNEAVAHSYIRFFLQEEEEWEQMRQRGVNMDTLGARPALHDPLRTTNAIAAASGNRKRSTEASTGGAKKSKNGASAAAGSASTAETLCVACQRGNHTENNCWYLHPELCPTQRMRDSIKRKTEEILGRSTNSYAGGSRTSTADLETERRRAAEEAARVVNLRAAIDRQRAGATGPASNIGAAAAAAQSSSSYNGGARGQNSGGGTSFGNSNSSRGRAGP